jgi:glycine/D-amino acid oxidase-like deaminating enzyme
VRSAVIVGAGTFGASLAWWLAREGVAVTLVDQFDPGDVRASSGGESRLIRSGHGADAGYTASARRAFALWRELEEECGEALLVECGVTWLAHREDGWETATAATLAAQGIPHARLAPEDGARLFPSWSPRGLAFLLHEPEAGVLRAQRAVRALARQAAAHGATVLRGRAAPAGDAVRLDDGTMLEGDAVVWSCGAWLGRLFGSLAPVSVTCQELYFLDGGPAWRDAAVPAYVDYDSAVYGTRDLDGLGVKAASDHDGPALDPDAPLPAASAAGEATVREYVAARFPALAGARLAGARTCRYELSRDGHFIAAAHPEHPSVWLLGGGSGHGFKHGPAIAERMARALRGGEPMPARFALGERPPGRSVRTAGGSR